MEEQTFTYDVSEHLKPNLFIKEGYSFNGWVDENGNTYLDEGEVNILPSVDGEIIKLIAQWTQEVKLVIDYYGNNVFYYDPNLDYIDEYIVSNVSVTANEIKVQDEVDYSLTIIGGRSTNGVKEAFVLKLQAMTKNSLYIDSEIFELEIDINPLPISVKLFEYSYKDDYRSFSSINNQIKTNNLIKFIDINNREFTIDGKYYTMNSMTDGKYNYNIESQDNVVGSTYQTIIELLDSARDNYVFINPIDEDTTKSYAIFKYKTVQIDNNTNEYYTIEDALTKSTKFVILLGNGTSISSYVITSFTSLSNSEGNPYQTAQFSLSSNKTLYVPYKADTYNINSTISGCEYTTDQVAFNKNTHFVYSVLNIPEHITLTVNSNANIKVGAKISCHQSSVMTNALQRGIIYNDGTIIFESNSSGYCYGYIKTSEKEDLDTGKIGTGEIIIEKDAYFEESMAIYDWVGGTAAKNMGEEVFISNAWSAHNNACSTKIYSGAVYSVNIFAILSLVGGQTLTISILGDQDTENSMFKPLTIDDNSYVIKSVKNAKLWSTDSKYNNTYNELYSITGSNQIKGQKDIVKVYGNFIDDTIYIKKGALGVYVIVKTSCGIAQPLSLGYMDLYVGENSHLKLTNSDYLFLPGSKLEVMPGGTLEIGSNSHLSFATYEYISSITGDDDFNKYMVDVGEDAKFIINGDVILNGSVSGFVTSTVNGSKLDLTQTSLKTKYNIMYNRGNSPYYATNSNNNLFGYLYSQNDEFSINTFKNSVYYFFEDAWLLSEGTLKFELNGGQKEGSNNITVNLHENNVLGFKLTDIILDIHKPTRQYYIFDGWYLDSNFNENSLALNKTIFADTVLYAKWVPQSFKINYELDNFIGCESDGLNYDISDDNILIKNFDITTKYSLPDKSILLRTGYSFADWYLDEDFTISISEISYDTLISLNNGVLSDITLYGVWVDANSTLIDIIFIPNNGYEEFIVQRTSSVLPSYNPENYNSINNDPSEMLYFDGWYLTDEFNESDKLLSWDKYISDGVTQITLYGKWVEKLTVSYGEDNYYYVPNSIIKLKDPLDDFTEEVKEEKRTINEFLNWKITKENGDEITVSKDDVAKTTLTVDQNIVIAPDWDVTTQYYVSYTTENASITLKVDNVSIVNNSYVDQNTTINITINYTYTTNRELKINNTIISNSPTSYEHSVTSKTTISATSKENSGGGGCFIEGTLITLADGSIKPIELITRNDNILVFNHFTGKYEIGRIWFTVHADIPSQEQKVLTLYFDNNIDLSIVHEHAIFDMTLNKYVYITYDNVDEFIGHEFVATKYVNNELINYSVKLNSYDVTVKEVKVYSPISEVHLNVVGNSILTATTSVFDLNELINIFEYNDDLLIDEEMYAEDIEKYGLYTYDELKDYISYETYIKSPIKYFKVAVGKGLVKFEDIEALIKFLHESEFIS